MKKFLFALLVAALCFTTIFASEPLIWSVSSRADVLKGDARGGETYQRIRSDFVADATTLGIDLNDAATIPPRLSADHWPGVAAVFERLVGKLPTPRAVS